MTNQETCYLCGKPSLPFENRLHVQCDQREYAFSDQLLAADNQGHAVAVMACEAADQLIAELNKDNTE